MYLSKRLEEVASFVHEGGRVADVGTDHGYIPIALVKEKKAVSAIAMDVRKGPLERASEHIREYGLTDLIAVRLSDGLKELRSGEADTVVIAGMGGELIIRIMTEGIHMWDSVSQWVLSPQSEIAEVRRFLSKNGMLIERESMIKEDGKFYTIISACPKKHEKEAKKEIAEEVTGKTANEEVTKEMTNEVAEENVSEATGEQKIGFESEYIVEELYGELLLKEKHPILREFLQKEQEVKESILKGLEGNTREQAAKRREELERELAKNREALSYF